MKQTRREFLRSTLQASTLAALAPCVPAFLCRAALGAGPRRAGDDRTVLIIVQLSGGNDGLNCVVPYADDEYARRRTTLRLTAREVLKLDDYAGLHPDLKECRRMFDEQMFSVVQGVAYPKSSRQHPEAERDWQTGRPGDADWPVGWVGRFADCVCEKDPAAVPAALVTPFSRPMSVNTEHAIIPAIRSVEDTLLPAGRADATAKSDEGHPLLDFVRTSARKANEMSGKIRAATAGGGAYPPTQIGQRLKTIATLIRAEVGFRIFYTELGGDGFGGFDNHANQKENHAALLKQFSGAVGAFMDDLKRDGLAERVALMTVSEFGRTVTENGRRGTNHGEAAPVFLAGGRLKGGLIGPHPDMRHLDNDAPRFHTDFRRVYAAMLETWLGCDAEMVLGGKFEPLELFRS